ncbi:MAG: hypothetical protein AAGU23_05100 [Bacillota bacterium]|mgnify:CR=1 FL=1|nr:hypothetical protein [Bacillota bacterium]
MSGRHNINVDHIQKAVENCCLACTVCHGKNCRVGFAKIMSGYAGLKQRLSIPRGIDMVPSGDDKAYNPDRVANALAVINYECRNCMDNHEDNCVVNIARSAMEVLLFGEHVEFCGNSQEYMQKLSRLNAEYGAKVTQAYLACRDK